MGTIVVHRLILRSIGADGLSQQMDLANGKDLVCGHHVLPWA